MKLFDVYPLLPIEPIHAEGHYIYDKNNTAYLDLYGGHAVISIGHTHPHYVKRITTQLSKLAFYSNAVQNSLQTELAEKLGHLAQCKSYQLFLSNSGAEANENALKLASFYNNRSKILSFKQSFHGRTSGAVAITDNAKINAPFNAQHSVDFIPLNDEATLKKALETEEYAAVIIEGIQGIAGIYEPNSSFLTLLAEKCKTTNTVLILDEIQSGYGRSGNFFAFQSTAIEPDIITTAKGMGNGFPIAGTLIHPKFKPVYGMLGTTFGGNHLACAAALAVLEVMETENLIQNAQKQGAYLIEKLQTIPHIKTIRGRGLMLGIEWKESVQNLRNILLNEYKIFTGNATNPNVLRILPALNIGKKELDIFINAIQSIN